MYSISHKLLCVLKAKRLPILSFGLSLLFSCAPVDAAKNGQKQAEISISCDKDKNTYQFSFIRYVDTSDLTSFEYANTHSTKAQLSDNCVLARDISIETDINFQRKDDFEIQGTPDSGSRHILKKSAADMYITSQGKIIAQMLGINHQQTLTVNLDKKQFQVCENRVSTPHCGTYSIEDLAKEPKPRLIVGISAFHIN